MADVEFADRAAYLPSADALVLADLHIGRDATSNVSFPLGERHDLTARLSTLTDRFSPTEIVLAGDVLHAFDRLPEEVHDTFADLEALAGDAGATLVVVRGNHDTRVDELTDTHAEYPLADDTVVCHGHEEPEGSAPRYVIGHDHPAIEIEGKRRPCYLHGPNAYRDSDLLVLPAFSRFASGMVVNDLRGSGFQSPLVTGTDPLCPIVRDEETDETYRFPPLAEFRRLL
ncbi:metallophosphoesterase [Haladaptatus sp. DYF46]|uniref:metallophosphoesterase n=1 Tax=Haladaptatus sp. DYF46 TaxID=2886041 RepID=UPI001E6332C4|nr:metallophosphoesterase [Haladaptatus sp. DYF46]